MKGLILAAGRGSRMGALTQDAPKCLVRLGARTLLERQLESLRTGGCDTVAIVTGYRREVLEPFADSAFHNENWAATNMVSSLFCAQEWLVRDKVVVSYSDIFYSPETVARLVAAPGDLAISYDPNWYDLWAARADDPLADAETFRRDTLGRVTEIGQRAMRREEVQGQYMGLLRFTPSAWGAVCAAVSILPEERQARLDMTSLLSLLIARDVAIQSVPCVGLWGECDTASDVALYETWIKNGRLSA